MAIEQLAHYIARMTRYTLAQAETRLSELMDRALNGEGVVIMRGKAGVELKVIARPSKRAKSKGRPDTPVEKGVLALLRSIPEERKRAAEKEVREMRDEGEA